MDDWKHTGRTVVKPRECLLSTLSVCRGLDLLDTQVQGIFYNVFTQNQ